MALRRDHFISQDKHLCIDLLHLKHRPMLRRRIALSFDLNLNPFYSVKVNLLDFNDANNSLIFSIDSVLSRCTCIKSNDPSLFSIIVDLTADKVLFNLENNLSGSAVITSNVMDIRENFLPATPFGAKMALPNAPRWIRHCRQMPTRPFCFWAPSNMIYSNF